MTLRAPSLATLGILAATTAGGCGITDPYTHPAHPAAAASTSTATTSATTSAGAQDPSEPATATGPAARSPVTGPGPGDRASSPRAALERYARLYINWTDATLAAHQRQLAALSEGTARAQALQAAATYAHDPLLTHGQVANQGQIVAISPGAGPAHGRWVIVTSEHTTGHSDYQGLPTTTHLTYAQLDHTSNGWLVRQWSPQS